MVTAGVFPLMWGVIATVLNNAGRKSSPARPRAVTLVLGKRESVAEKRENAKLRENQFCLKGELDTCFLGMLLKI